MGGQSRHLEGLSMLRRTGFTRQPVERLPLPAPRPVRAVAKTAIGGSVVAQPKTQQHRNRRLLDLAKGKPCLLRVPGVCQGGIETTVAAHSNWAIHGKAGARKADDQYTAWGCMACHQWLDQGPAPRAQKEAVFMAAHHRQVMEWRFMAADTGIPVSDRKAALWALDLLGATPSIYQLDDYLCHEIRAHDDINE